jgi:hypothetical protein
MPFPERSPGYDNYPGADRVYYPSRFLDNLGKLKISESQNLFEADFEYGGQPMRWEQFTQGSATIVPTSGIGGIVMNVTTGANDLCIRQTRPYIRYQPGKTSYMATGMLFGPPVTNARQRCGFFDDGNGCFFEQADATATTNPAGMFVVWRTDTGGIPVDTRIPFDQWLDPGNIKDTIDWNRIQMYWVEYAWYGAGTIRWGVVMNGVPHVLHQIGFGNYPSWGPASASPQRIPWARTGNLPVRYELRNVGTAAAASSMQHFGVSVLAEGKIDQQRGFTYGYGMAPAAPTRAPGALAVRYPLLSIRYRVMGTLEYGVDAAYSGANGTLPAGGAAIQAGATTTSCTVAGNPWTAGQWVGKYVFFRGTGAVGQGQIGRITANTTNSMAYVDNVTGLALATAPAAGANYILGVIDRGQILPQTLQIYSSANCQLELICSTFSSPIVLTGAAFETCYKLGSLNSFAERDVSATGLTGGEVVYNSPLPAGGLQNYDLSSFFPLYNTIRGSAPDILTVAITTPAAFAGNVGAGLIGQEAMS